MSNFRKISQFVLRFEGLMQDLNAAERDMLRLMLDGVFRVYNDVEDENDAV